MNQRFINNLKILTLFFFICLFISCARGQTEAEKSFYQAYKCEKLDCKINFLNKAIESNPKYAAAYWGRGNAYFIQNKHKEKQADLIKAVELSPDYKEIIDAYDKVSKIYPDNKYIADIQGGLFIIIGSDSQAFDRFNKAVKLDSNFASAYFNRGTYYENQSENEKALADFAKAIELDPQMAVAYYRRGAIFALIFKNFEKGFADLNKAIELNPDFIAAYNSRAVVNKIKGNYEKAILDLTKSIELAPNNIQIYKFRASVYKELGKIDLAEKDEAKAKELESKSKNQNNN